MQPEDFAALIEHREYEQAAQAIRRGFDINSVDEYGRTALVYVILSLDQADADAVQFLLQNGANPNNPDKGQKWTPMHFVSRNNRLDLAELLLEFGASVDPLDVFGNTPLWRCVMNCGDDFRLVRRLLLAGADPNRKNSHGKSPLDVARIAGLEHLVSVLTDGGT